MRIALVVPAPFDTISAGYAYDRRIVAALRAGGHDVQVVELAGSHPLTDDAARDAARAALDSMPRDRRPVIDGLALPAFATLDAALRERRAAGLIHHPTALESGFTEEQREALREAERRIMPTLGRVIATSDATSERLIADFAVAADRVSVIVPGAEDPPRSTGSGGAACAILSVGALVQRKGHDTLLRALARLFDLDWQLTIAGADDRDPVHVRTLSALAETLGIAARVRFAGALGDAALEPLWRGADMFALATNWEGYPTAVAEALRRGLPIAVTAGGAAAASVPVEAGIVCQPGDHEGLSKAMRRMIFSRDLRAGMSDVAWEAGQALPSWAAQAAAFAASLDQA